MAEIERTRERERGTIPETPSEFCSRSRREYLDHPIASFTSRDRAG